MQNIAFSILNAPVVLFSVENIHFKVQVIKLKTDQGKKFLKSCLENSKFEWDGFSIKKLQLGESID